MKFFLIAGEASGDVIGAGVVRELKAQQPDAEILGIGGPLMEAEGMSILLPMDQLSVMGIWEIVPKLPHLYQIYKNVLAEIEQQKPDALVTIDLPDFNFLIGRALKKRGNPIKIIHDVAPTVWAWRPGRAKKIAKFLDGIICLFPFEPAYFEKHDLKAIYAGHPLIESKSDQGDGKSFRENNNIPADAKTLGLFFGSRRSELARMSDVIKIAAQIADESCDEDIYMIVPTTSHMEFDVLQALDGFPSRWIAA